jgi:NitT/TauT family transport system ATP-binding protein
MSAPPLVQFQDAAKRYGTGPLILQGLNFTAHESEFITFIGPSGCGKSTVLRLLAGLSPLSSGSLLIDGLPPSKGTHELAFVFQDPTLLPWLTVEKNVEVPLTLRGAPAAQRSEVCRRALALVKLAHKARQHPRQLSGGERMRVSLARALSLSPKILLLDEPFGALDEITRDQLNEELLAIREQQRWTAFFVTHSVAEAVFLSSRIIVLAPNPGRIHAEIAVPLPYPRTADTRQSESFFRLISSVSRVLRSVETPVAVS